MQDARITQAAAEFPETFGLRGHEGTFRVSLASSYLADRALGTVMLYTEKLQPDGRWMSFAKGSPAELASQVVRLAK